ncbi:MAG: hypothetical protein JWP27_1555 [Flaviaesturariibacter sp.]|nr:hypothetical protein [Flaviaesturariibacter sp.]
MENSKGQNKSGQQDPNTDLQRERLSNGDNLGGQQNTGSGMRNTSGGTTDVGRNTQGGAGGRSSSGISTKRSVSGSDFDGQVSPE